MTAVAGLVGSAPIVEIKPTERAKYEAMWSWPEYRTVAPGEDAAMTFLRQAQIKPGAQIIDFGCGTGRGAALLSQLGADVTMLDFAANCLDESVRSHLGDTLRFRQHDLTHPSPVQAEYGYCTDVMEHLPPEQVDRVLVNILQAAQHVFFQISCVDDHLGALIGQPLHLTVRPYEWWHKKLQSLDCVMHWSRNDGHQALFYVTAWQDARKVVEIGALNVTEEQVRAHVRTNIAAGWQQVQPHPTNDAEVMILAGGPSLQEHQKQIHEMREAGVKLVTLNGSYNWAVTLGFKPSAQIIVDAREFNARFTKPVVPGCKYLIASQCHPSVLDGLPQELTYLWHTGAEQIKDDLDAAYPVWWLVPGGSTVMLRAIPLLRMLGFKRFHLFGFDSCLADRSVWRLRGADGEFIRHGTDGYVLEYTSEAEATDRRDYLANDYATLSTVVRIDAHHAYAQPENDSETVIPVTVGGRTFRCHAWQVAQAQEFMDLVKFLGDEIELEVYGDGLINHILRTGADLSDAKD